MSRHVTDETYLGTYEISVYENSRASHSVDVKRKDGTTIAAYTGITDSDDALVVGKAYVSGYEQGGRENHSPQRPAPAPQQNHLMVRVNDVIREAGGLLSDGDGDNPEYDRALVELIGRIVGIDLSDESSRDAVLAMLRAMG